MENVIKRFYPCFIDNMIFKNRIKNLLEIYVIGYQSKHMLSDEINLFSDLDDLAKYYVDNITNIYKIGLLQGVITHYFDLADTKPYTTKIIKPWSIKINKSLNQCIFNPDEIARWLHDDISLDFSLNPTYSELKKLSLLEQYYLDNFVIDRDKKTKEKSKI